MDAADRLDESRDVDDMATDWNVSQLDDIYRLFLCALKAVDAAGTNDPSIPLPIDKSDFEHIASNINLVNYA